MDEEIRRRLKKSSNVDSEYTSPRVKPISPSPERITIPYTEPEEPEHESEEVIPLEPETPKPKKQRNIAKKSIIFILLLAILGGATSASFWYYKKHKNTGSNNNQPTSTQQSDQPTGTVRLIASGDNLTFDSINAAAKKSDGSYDYLPMYAKVKPFFDKPDARLCTESVPTGPTSLGITGYPNFNAPLAFAKGLGDLGCNIVNMGTFHMNDKGQAAIDASVAYWDKQPNMLAFAGANRSADEQNKIRYFSVKRLKFAFLSYTTSSNNASVSPYGVNIYSDALAQKQIAEAHKNAQFIIIGMNWGKEDSNDIAPDQDKIAQTLTDQGVNVIIGVGPHVLQPTKSLTSSDKKHQTFVWYSLGNLLNSQIPVENLIGGIAVMDIDVASQQVKEPKLLPVYMHYEWTAAQKKSQTQADLLARHDFLLYPLDQATDALFASQQNTTTVQAQTDRVNTIMNKFTPVKVIKSSEF